MTDIKQYLNQIANAIYGEEVRSPIINALSKVNDDNESYQNIKEQIVQAKDHIDEQSVEFDVKFQSAQDTISALSTATINANAAEIQLSAASLTANTAKTNLEAVAEVAGNGKRELDSSIDVANAAIANAETAKMNLDNSISSANNSKTALQGMIDSANSIKATLDDTNETSANVKRELDSSIANAVTANDSLQSVIDDSLNVKSELSDIIGQSLAAKNNLNSSIANANTVLQSISSENSAAVSNIDELRSENFNSQEILSGVADLRAYLGLTDEDILGVQVDYKNKTLTRIAGAVNLTKGADFDRFSMFGGRKRCNVADDGTIVAWFGDADYKEDGSMGQVMVYQPKFYYLVYPVVYDPIETGIGYHLRKANYYVSEKPRAGFRLHPAFYDANGNEIDYILDSAFEGSIWDADGGTDGTGAYLLLDEQIMDIATDKFCSIAGAKPASGLTQNLTRPNIEQMAQNRGDGWHGDLIKPVSARQLLMIIEMGMMNMQSAIANGVVSISDNSAYNCSSLTGSTSSLGNGTGQAAQTINEKGGTTTTETTNGKTAITWRGTENPWGNIWKFVYGINIWGNGAMGGGQPFICTDFNFAESKNSGNYEGAGFTVTNTSGYVSAMGYSTKCDWLFIASECSGNSTLPVGDYHYITQNLNAYRIARLGGYWDDGAGAGGFFWALTGGVGYRYRTVGGRLVYVPTKQTATAYQANINAWKQKMVA